MKKPVEMEEVANALYELSRAHGYMLKYELRRWSVIPMLRGWHDQSWRRVLQLVLMALDRPYLVVVLDNDGKRCASFATAKAEELPSILRSIALDLESKTMTVENIEGGN